MMKYGFTMILIRIDEKTQTFQAASLSFPWRVGLSEINDDSSKIKYGINIKFILSSPKISGGHVDPIMAAMQAILLFLRRVHAIWPSIKPLRNINMKWASIKVPRISVRSCLAVASPSLQADAKIICIKDIRAGGYTFPREV
jgi:hypothetical protein